MDHGLKVELKRPVSPDDQRQEPVYLWDPTSDSSRAWKQSVLDLCKYITEDQQEISMKERIRSDVLIHEFMIMIQALDSVNQFRFSGLFSKSRVPEKKDTSVTPSGDLISSKQHSLRLSCPSNGDGWYRYSERKPDSESSSILEL